MKVIYLQKDDIGNDGRIKGLNIRFPLVISLLIDRISRYGIEYTAGVSVSRCSLILSIALKQLLAGLALYTITNELCLSIDSNKHTIVMLLDMSSVFDTLD